jgi:hypothetical protein
MKKRHALAAHGVSLSGRPEAAHSNVAGQAAFHFLQRHCFDLPDPFSGNAEFIRQFMQGGA